MTRIGNNLWFFDQSYWWIGQSTLSGALGATFFPSDNTIKDLAWDGSNIWAINPSGMIIGYSPSGSLTGAIPGLLSGGWGLTFGGTHLWASDPDVDKIYQISLQGEMLKGDVNSDGSVDLLDLVDIVNHILGLQVLEGISVTQADCNEDGEIDVVDALGLVNVILEIGGCESVPPKAILSGPEMEILESLKTYVSPAGYRRFMTLVKHELEIPSEYSLSQNYPNPFNPETEIAFHLPEHAHVNLTVYNAMGQRVEILLDAQLDAGQHVIRWNGEGFASGVYFYRLAAGGTFRDDGEPFKATRRMILMK